MLQGRFTKPPRHGVTKEHEKAGKDLGVDWKKGSHILFDKVAQRVPLQGVSANRKYAKYAN